MMKLAETGEVVDLAPGIGSWESETFSKLVEVLVLQPV